MKIAMLVLITLGYYGLLLFLDKRGKIAFEKKAVTALGDTINLDATEDANATDLFGEVNNNVDSNTLSELTALLDADKELASNMTNMIDDIEAVAPPPSIIPPVKKAIIETVALVNHEKVSKEFPIQKPNLIQALEGLDNQDAIIEESDIDDLMSQVISKQE